MAPPGPGKMASASDSQLFDAAKRGRTEAFEELVRRYFGRVYAIAFARLNDCDEAEDLTQEVFVRVWLSLPRLDGGQFSHWLTRVTRNLAIDWYRSTRRANRLCQMLQLEELPAEASDPRVGNVCEAVLAN